MNMTRRVSALLGMAIILGLAAALVWRVYLHHRDATHEEEIVIVSFYGLPA
jgi:hypothetical protein